jgi:vacuolar-type H+-ATPase subunit I/STV1
LIKRFEKLDEILKNIDFSLVKNIFSNTKYDFEDITLENIIDKKEEKLETLNRKKDRLNESIQTLNNKLN